MSNDTNLIYFLRLIDDDLYFLFASILGVQSDCSQEQIRKHYKKIAVLVHPDKNKQPGAEEAFKILQRAFELIGEPVMTQLKYRQKKNQRKILIKTFHFNCRKAEKRTIKVLPKL